MGGREGKATDGWGSSHRGYSLDREEGEKGIEVLRHIERTGVMY